MRKAIITQEQADAIEHRLKKFDRDFTMDLHKQFEGNWILDSKPLNELSNSELAKALYIGYEVEPVINVGDWVTVIEHEKEKYVGITALVTNTNALKSFPIGLDFDNENEVLKLDDVRHATPEEIAEEKERRWWKKHGRQPWELRFDDVIIHKKKHEIIRVIDVQSKGEVIVFINGGYRETLNITYVKQLYSVVCFVDDRKDVKE